MLFVPASNSHPSASSACLAAPGLKAKRLQRILTSDAFHSELTHILARPIHIEGNYRDGGAMCRDNAWLAACTAARMGFDADICSGQAALFWPLGDGRQGCLHFETHSWTDIETFGVCDFSPDLRDGKGPGWRGWPAKWLVASHYFPRHAAISGVYCQTDADFARAMDEARGRPEAYSTVYGEAERRPFDNMLFVGAVNFALSPLMKELSRAPFFSLDLLGKAAEHLWGVVKGKTETLTGLPQAEAWKEIARIDSAAVERLRRKLFAAELSEI